MPTAALLRNFTAYTPGIKPTWDVREIRNALTNHESGNFTSSSRLVDAMGRDDRLIGVLDTRIKGLLGASFSMQASDPSNEKSVEIAEGLGDHWWSMFPEDELAELLQWRILMGFALAELVWERTAAEWMPRLKVWHPQWVYHNECEDRWYVQTRQGQELIEPGNGKWLLLGRGSRPYMHGSVRSLGLPFLIRQFALRDWARYAERHGMPLVMAKIPAMAEGLEKEEFFEDMLSLGTETTVTLPQNIDAQGASYSLELLEAKDGSWESFKALADQMSDIYAVHLLGNNLTSEVRGGSFAASQTGDSVRHDIRKADAEELSTQLKTQALEQVTYYNYPQGPEMTPWPRWDVEPPDDTKAEAEAIKTAGEAIQAMRAAGYEIDDVEAFGERYGVRLVTSPEQPMSESDSISSEEMARIFRKVRLASGDDPGSAQGFVEGQLYVDDIAEDGAKRSSVAMRPDLKALLAIIETSTDYADLRVRLREAYGDMPIERFGELMAKALVLSDLAGQHAVLTDL